MHGMCIRKASSNATTLWAGKTTWNSAATRKPIWSVACERWGLYYTIKIYAHRYKSARLATAPTSKRERERARERAIEGKHTLLNTPTHKQWTTGVAHTLRSVYSIYIYIHSHHVILIKTEWLVPSNHHNSAYTPSREENSHHTHTRWRMILTLFPVGQQRTEKRKTMCAKKYSLFHIKEEKTRMRFFVERVAGFFPAGEKSVWWTLFQQACIYILVWSYRIRFGISPPDGCWMCGIFQYRIEKVYRRFCEVKCFYDSRTL